MLFVDSVNQDVQFDLGRIFNETLDNIQLFLLTENV